MLPKLTLPIFVTGPVATTLLPICSSSNVTFYNLATSNPRILIMFYASSSLILAPQPTLSGWKILFIFLDLVKHQLLFWNPSNCSSLATELCQVYSLLTNTSQFCDHLCLSPQCSLHSLRKVPGSYPTLHSRKQE